MPLPKLEAASSLPSGEKVSQEKPPPLVRKLRVSLPVGTSSRACRKGSRRLRGVARAAADTSATRAGERSRIGRTRSGVLLGGLLVDRNSRQSSAAWRTWGGSQSSPGESSSPGDLAEDS